MSVLQPWVEALPFMQQSVLIAAVRAPDGLRKNHPVKVLMRWFRRCTMLSAFDKRALNDPFEAGGGSFTGPFELHHAAEFVRTPWPADTGFGWHHMNEMRKVYLDHVDEMPHHFQLHFMHAAQIVGYKHSDTLVREWWRQFYEMIVNDAHLFPEPVEMMDKRLGDSERNWRAREEVTAL
jgi:hypothetical protein